MSNLLKVEIIPNCVNKMQKMGLNVITYLDHTLVVLSMSGKKLGYFPLHYL